MGRKKKFSSLLQEQKPFKMEMSTKTFRKLYQQDSKSTFRDISNPRKAKVEVRKNVGRIEKDPAEVLTIKKKK